jgi:hypothetical protein
MGKDENIFSDYYYTFSSPETVVERVLQPQMLQLAADCITSISGVYLYVYGPPIKFAQFLYFQEML